ncbi:MFS transporter [Lysobacter sp. A03]|uniref:MFS transporter n=1 Tax=Lysobacter sp. A03 TaxID=1199154 RepID=UPI0005C724BB|nr:MFS transporter [Lysobacter sp. A03]
MTPDESGSVHSEQAPSALSPLRYPVFRGVWAASTVSNLGVLIQSVGASWLMIAIAPSADMVALVLASVYLPITLFSLVAGAVADNLDRRKVMLAAQGFMLIVSATLAGFAWSGLITPWLLLIFTFLMGCGSAFNGPAWQASVGDMVPRAELPGAVALNSMGFNIARSAGPAIGGAIVAAAGAAAAFAVSAVSNIGLIVVLLRWRPPANPQTLPRETLGIAVGAGVRFVAGSPAIRTVLVRSAVFCIAASGLMALMPLLAKDRLGGGPLTYGLLLGAFGVGAVAGAVGNAKLRQRISTGAIVGWTSVAFALAGAIAAVSTHLLVTMAALLVAGAGWLLALATFNVAVQMSAPRWVVARALSIYQMAAFGGLASGSWLWGEVAASTSVTLALLAASVVMLGGAALGRWWPVAQTKELNLDLLHLWKEPSTVVPVDGRTGPVVITIEYAIREADLAEFMGAMVERRRVRRRDGARNWRLLRDLADPEVWIERYETPTWLDYVRHNSRKTHHDAAISERIRALHCGHDGPVVRRMIERQCAPIAPRPARERLIDPTRVP